MRVVTTAMVALSAGAAVAALGSLTPAPGQPSSVAERMLRSPAEFTSIADPRARSLAIFQEAGKVLTSPRCVNCHPAGDRPLQTDAERPHQPMAMRGADGHGAPGLRCDTCHGKANYDPARVPGHPEWHLAPLSMAWEGKTLGQICVQIKDPARNGGRTLVQIHDHMTNDSLVGWAWAPGYGRRPAPGTQQQAGALVDAWVKTGAACPN
jgi:hypothetical protein